MSFYRFYRWNDSWVVIYELVVKKCFDYMEQMLRSQLASAIGREVGTADVVMALYSYGPL